VQDWHIEGSYYETCNCDAICPCRRQDGVPGGDSTYEDCEFLLSWWIMAGRAGDVDLGGIRTAIAGRYSDAEENKPWTVMLYIDRAASDPQFEALSDIFLGRAGGDISFAQNIAHVAGVNRADIALDHGKGHESIRVGDVASARVARYVDHDYPVSCGITGHDKPGRESVCDSSVKDGPFDWTYEGRCGFSSRFAYEGAAG
jgi:hypothetical protein